MSGQFSGLRTSIRANPALKRLALVIMRSLSALSWQIRPAALIRYAAFLGDWKRFRKAGGKAAVLDFYPCLHDRTSATGIDTHYFHQAIWALREIRQSGATQHVDIGSDVNFVGMLTVVTEVLFVDIRPLFLNIQNYQGIGASVTALPFAANSIASLSCMHVLEHIGLGRYGDPIDPLGPEKACREIVRVLQPGGHAYVSTLIGRPRVAFNGHRIFAVREVLAMFAGLEIESMAMVDAPGRFVTGLDPDAVDIHESEGGLDFGLGLFRLRKPAGLDHSGGMAA
jgi:SAM-dependent methyltransferase